MKICQTHWEYLRAGIETRGLTKFVAPNGEAATEQMVEDLNQTKDPTKPYDPLMSAHWMLTNKMMDMGGLYLMTHNSESPDGHFCPLCEYQKYCLCPCGKTPQEHAQEWMDSAMDFILDDFKKNGWLAEPTVQ